MRPKKGDVIAFLYRKLKRKGTVIAVSEAGVHYLVKSGLISYRIGLSQVVEIIEEEEVRR